MKTKLRKALCLLSAFFMLSVGNAWGEVIIDGNGIEYELNPDNTATVTGLESGYPDDIVIPSVVSGNLCLIALRALVMKLSGIVPI